MLDTLDEPITVDSDDNAIIKWICANSDQPSAGNNQFFKSAVAVNLVGYIVIARHTTCLGNHGGSGAGVALGVSVSAGISLSMGIGLGVGFGAGVTFGADNGVSSNGNNDLAFSSSNSVSSSGGNGVGLNCSNGIDFDANVGVDGDPREKLICLDI